MKNTQDMQKIMGRLVEIGENINMDSFIGRMFDENTEHYTMIKDLTRFNHPTYDDASKIKIHKDADIETAKGRRGGYRVNSIFSTFTSRSTNFSINAEETKHNEKDFNMYEETSWFINYCIDNGYATIEEIDAMSSLKIGSEQAVQYNLNKSGTPVNLNAYGLHSVYGNHLRKITNAIDKKMLPAVKLLQNMFPNEKLEEKSERWIYDKAKSHMSAEWNNEIAVLFNRKDVLAAQFSQKANTLTIGDSPFKYALTMASLYSAVFSREISREKEALKDYYNSNTTGEAETFEYMFSGISSVFSLFTIGTADFLYQYKQLKENKEIFEKENVQFNANAVMLRFDEKDRELATQLYKSQFGFWEQNIEFKLAENGNDIRFLDIFTVEHASDSSSLLKQASKQKLKEKDLSNVGNAERKERMLKDYAKTEFRVHGLFNMKHDFYKGKVVHSKMFQSSIKMWLTDVVAENKEQVKLNAPEDMMSFGRDVDKDERIVSKFVASETEHITNAVYPTESYIDYENNGAQIYDVDYAGVDYSSQQNPVYDAVEYDENQYVDALYSQQQAYMEYPEY